jgi:uncharacterized protein
MFVLIYIPGPAWQMVKTEAELPFYREHCTYMDQVFASGHLLAGGPFLDHQGALGLLAVEDEAQARDIVEHDPFVLAGVVEPHLHPWQDAYFTQYQARRTKLGS